jgi:hypothetical protein
MVGATLGLLIEAVAMTGMTGVGRNGSTAAHIGCQPHSMLERFGVTCASEPKMVEICKE